MGVWQKLSYRYQFLNAAERLIVLNVLCFVVPFLLNTLLFLFQASHLNFLNWLHLSADLSIWITRPWTLVSYSFLHAGFFHLFWNMLLLYYAGMFFLNLFKPTTFYNVYFLGVLSGGIVFLLSYALFPVFKGMYPPLVGASAGVMAVFIFISTYTPDQEIRLLFFNVKLKYLAIAFVLLDLIQIPYGNAGGHLAHIGGAALGFAYAKQLQEGRDIGAPFAKVLQRIKKWFQPASNLKTVYRSQSKSTSSSSVKRTSSEQQRIDDILDKISASGYDSLSKEEKDILFRAGGNP
jgi:membrane associated rhomboid family serine protease